MRRVLSLIVLIAALLTSSIAFAQAGDADGDGIGDSRDRCPNAAGPVETMGCPDNDNDGVVDIDDACAAVPGIPENAGCPNDDDGDGVGNFEDACPTEVGTAANRGCINPPDDGAAGDPTPVPGTSNPNPLVPPADGPCQAATFLNGRVNARNSPRAGAEVIAQLDPNVLYPVKGLIALPDEEPFYAVGLYQDVFIPLGAVGGFDPNFLGGVFVAASALKVGGDCERILIGLLLPAVQKVREAAARASSGGLHVAVGDLNGDGFDTSYVVTMSDLLISSLHDDGSTEATGGGGGAGKAVFQDLHIAVPRQGFLIGTVEEGEDGTPVLHFDLVDALPDGDQPPFVLDLTTPEDEPQPLVGVIWYLFKKMVALVDKSGEDVDTPGGTDNGGVGEEQPDSDEDGGTTGGDTASCSNNLLDTFAAAGAAVHAVETPYGLDFVLDVPDGIDPTPCSESRNIRHRMFAIVDRTQVDDDGTEAPGSKFMDLESWSFTPTNSALMKVGPGTLALGGAAISEDGAVCIDLQPEGAAPLCVPAAPEPQ